jgi:hypothetical protein
MAQLDQRTAVPSRNGIVIHFERRIYVLSRRQFLTSTLAAGVALVSQKATAQPAKRTIVDAQVHLWKAEEDWRVLGMKPQMPEPFTIEKLVPLMDQAGVDRVVVVPPGDRNDYRRSSQALSQSLRGHGPHPVEEPASGGAVA